MAYLSQFGSVSLALSHLVSSPWLYGYGIGAYSTNVALEVLASATIAILALLNSGSSK